MDNIQIHELVKLMRINSDGLRELNLKGKQLSRVPDAVTLTDNNLGELQELYLNWNRLVKLPKGICQLKKLIRFDVSYNSLTGIPEDVANLEELQELNLHNNRLEELPKGICQLKKLIRFDVSYNSLTGIPEDVANLEELQELNLHINRLEELPKGICQLKKLIKLFLSSNQLTRIPEDVANLEELQELNLNNNRLEELPKGICQLKKLIKLNLSSNQLTRIPEDVANLEELQELNLNNNRLEELPKGICQLKKLIRFDVSYNSLTGIPEDVAYLEELQELCMQHNRLEELPKGICQSKKLIRFVVSFNSLTRIPEDVANLEELQELNLHDNRLEELPKGICQLKKLIKLDVSSNKLTGIPEEVANLEELQELCMQHNRLEELPKGICQLKKLIKLFLSSNQLTRIPEDVAYMEDLQQLYLNWNRLEELPKGICQLKKLIKLNLSSNQLTSIPEDVANLEQLQELNLHNNRLEELPKGICQLKKLIRFDVSCNRLTSIPEYVVKLEKLQVLYLNNNRLEELPEGICHLKNLSVLRWHNNPLRVPPVAICSKGLSYIVAYLQDIRRGKTLHHKIVLLGSSGAGKTSLAKTLAKNKPSCVQKEDTTIVVDRTIWETETDGAIMNIIMTDFGGNHWYKTVHHLFLDEKALILLVVNLARYSGQIFNKEAGSWLNVLMSRVPKAQVFLVGTQIDRLENKESIRLKKLQVLQDVSCFVKQVSDQSVRFEDMITVSSKTLQGIEDLRKLVKHFVLKNGQVIPSSWSEIYSDLQNFKIAGNQQFLTFNAVIDLVIKKSKDTGVQWLVNNFWETKERRAETVLSFFHNVGALTWYEHSHELKKFVFHWAEFLVQLMKAVFSERLSAESLTYQGSFKNLFTSVSFEEAKENLLIRGIMSHDFLRCIWSHLHLEQELYDALTKLFVHLDLCYPMDEAVCTSPLRFPWFLTQKAPEIQGVQMMLHSRPRRSSHRLSLKYVYPAMCPEPLYHIFVVRLHRHVHDIKSRHDWKDGLYVRIKGTEVLVHKSHQAMETAISIFAEGSDLLEVWTVLLSCQETLTGVMNEWTGIRMECWIVCPHCMRTRVTDHGRFPASNLDKKCPKGRVTCDRHDEQIPACLVYPVVEDFSRHQKVLEEYTNQLAEDVVGLPDNQVNVKEGTPSNDELEELAAKIGDSWKKLGRRLQFDEAKLTAFHEENEQYSEKAYRMLLSWKRRNGPDACYDVLHYALCHHLVGHKDLATEFCCD